MALPNREYTNWPNSLECKLPYVPPPKGANPAVRGTILAAGAPLVETFGFVAKYLYNNAGFNTLRGHKALKDTENRWDPTVTPLPTAEEKDVSSLNYTSPDTLSKSLLNTTNGAPLYWSIRDYHQAYKSGEITPTQVVNALLPIIRRDVANRSEHSTAFLTTKVDIVLAAAEASTKRWAEGKPLGLLDGVPVAVKDEVELANYPQTFGSKKVFVANSSETTWAIRKWEELGAVVVGKTNMHEVGMDTTNNNCVTGTPLNPYNDRYYTGGSSGGSGYAVSTGLVPFALGSDGGGSIRIPSNYCGVFGLKPSQSRVSIRPSVNVANSVVVAGPMAPDVESLEVAYRVMATPDPEYSASARFAAPRPLSAPRKKVLGIPTKWFNQADEPVRAACQAAVDWFVKESGYTAVDIDIPLLNEGQTAHALTILLEARNGMPAPMTYLQPANRILMALAKVAPAKDLFAAQKVRQVIMQHLAYLYDTHGHDMIIVHPTTPNAGWSHTPADLKKGISDGDMTLKSMMYVWMANFCGNPCMQMPVGFVPPTVGHGEIPVGISGMGVWGGEEGLIEWAYEGEKYLHEVRAGGRLKSPKWVDVIALAKGGQEKGKDVVAEPAKVTNGAKTETFVPAETAETTATKTPDVAAPIADAKAA
ncbi:amidase signature enzyme [Microthyrium microscopicum]|uniref:Amidase signature enzyme n=1 Tax=Microthyrium microscopicum TaxID=703497 RepID=A0A6A6U9Q5_9PEZI|nr:amidase signature enzyme [Microthyrium microscopicum]